METMMLHDFLKNIMSLPLEDTKKEILITNALTLNKDILDQETCLETLKLSFSWVVESNRPMQVRMGWLVLNYLADQESVMIVQLTPLMFEYFQTFDKISYNMAEFISLIAWFFNLVCTPDMEAWVRCHITNVLRVNVNYDITILVNTSELLIKYPACIPVGDKRVGLCEVMIINIANLPLAKDSTQVAQLFKKMETIETLFSILLKDKAEKSNEDLMFQCLGFLHRAITDHSAEPCPALAAILNLVDQNLIPVAVRGILRSNQSHSRTLCTLCEWLRLWPRASLIHTWVLALMDGLEAERQFDILTEVTLATVDRLFMGIILPVVRPGVEHVVWRMIASSRHSPNVFYKVLNKIPVVITCLLNEKTDASHECLQMVVNMSCYMMTAFQRIDNLYDSVVQAMKDCVAYLPPGQFASDDTPNWSEAAQLQYAPSPAKRERSGCDRVGLNNLGNTCYMNSILQALVMTKRFCCTVLDSDAHSEPLLAELQVLFALLLHSRRRSISPEKLLALARPPGFLPGHQQDSSEFLTYLLDVLHEQEKLAATVTEIAVQGGAGDKEVKADAMEAAGGGAMTRWTTEEDLSNQNILQRKARSLADFTQSTVDDIDQLSNFHSNSTDSGIQSVCGDESTVMASSPIPYESLVQQCFGGRLRISFQCLQCQTESDHTDNFRDIQLAFPPGCNSNEEMHIQDLLDYFASPEELTGENQYRCDSCGGLQDAQRSVRILNSPVHLVLTLKRFQFNSKTGQRAKLLHRVQCSETIEVHGQLYKLYAAVVHCGSSVDTGHYYTLACDEVQWYIFNDSLVTPCSPPPWNPPDTPYILFYARPDEHLQPVVNLKALPLLPSHLMEIVNRDHIQWLRELQGEVERQSKRRRQQPPGRHNRDEDNDRGGNPPGSCGGGGINLPQNRFVF